MIGSTFAAYPSASDFIGVYGAFAGHMEPRVTEGHPRALAAEKGLTSTGRDERSLLLSQRGEEVQHERGLWLC